MTSSMKPGTRSRWSGVAPGSGAAGASSSAGRPAYICSQWFSARATATWSGS
jgi:hypothetical protein